VRREIPSWIPYDPHPASERPPCAFPEASDRDVVRLNLTTEGTIAIPGDEPRGDREAHRPRDVVYVEAIDVV